MKIKAQMHVVQMNSSYLLKKNSYAIKIKVDMHGWQTFFSLSLKVYFIITYL